MPIPLLQLAIAFSIKRKKMIRCDFPDKLLNNVLAWFLARFVLSEGLSRIFGDEI